MKEDPDLEKNQYNEYCYAGGLIEYVRWLNTDKVGLISSFACHTWSAPYLHCYCFVVFLYHTEIWRLFRLELLILLRPLMYLTFEWGFRIFCFGSFILILPYCNLTHFALGLILLVRVYALPISLTTIIGTYQKKKEQKLLENCNNENQKFKKHENLPFFFLVFYFHPMLVWNFELS